MSGQDHGENAAPLGRALQQAREARGLSEVQVGEAINLRATVVRAIERDDFTLCGGDVYARGHVRAYAKHIGLDAAPLLEAYAELKSRTSTPTPRTTGPAVPNDLAQSPGTEAAPTLGPAPAKSPSPVPVKGPVAP